MKIPLILAVIDPLQALPGASPEKGGLEAVAGHALVLTFAASLVVLVFSVWALFIRKPQRPASITPEEAAASLANSRRRRRGKQRFPTLAETGGLPPIKS